MKVLVVGGGGREHALAWKFARERSVSEVLCAPANAGISSIARVLPLTADDLTGLGDAAMDERVDLTVVGPELPLDAGITDLFTARGLRVLGPSRAAARLESSKVFAKDFMTRHGIPTARYRVCSDPDDARSIVASGELGYPVVVKADGLAAGKGVVVALDRSEADTAIADAMDHRQFGEAGARVVLEECMIGMEASFFALCDGRTAMPILSAQDHKRVFDNDEGPNTGGMGAIAPSPLLDASLQDAVMRTIVDPVMQGMRTEGYEYRGFLYVGLMLTCDGPRVVEFNVRFGDPEAQVVIPMVGEDLAPRLAAAADGRLGPGSIRVSDGSCAGVVIASGGYPGAFTTGAEIQGLDEASELDDVLVFHSGTRRDGEDHVVTAGGRVVTVVGKGPDLERAVARAYEGVSRISFDGMHYRRDIGRRTSV